MKKNIAILALTILFTANFAFAGGPQTIQDWLGLVESKTLGVESKIQSLEALISVANKKLAELKLQLANGDDPQCGYIRPNGKATTYANIKEMNNAGAFSISPGKCEDVPKGLFPDGISVSGSNPSCQKITQTLWEGKTQTDLTRQGTIDFQSSVGALNGFLVKNNYAVNGTSGNVQADGEWQTAYGPKTTEGIKKFQARYGIKQTGAVGPLTLAKINSMICGDAAVNPKIELKDVSVLDTQDNNRKISFFLKPGELNFNGLKIIKKGDGEDFLLNGAILGIKLIKNANQKTITNIDLYSSKSSTALNSCGPTTYIKSLNKFSTNGIIFQKYFTSVNDGSGNTYTYSTVNNGTCYNIVVNIGGDCAKFTCEGPNDKYEKTLEQIENNVLTSITFFRNDGH